MMILWTESQKGINAVQRCSIEKQKGTVAIVFVSDSVLVVLSETSLIIIIALLDDINPFLILSRLIFLVKCF